MVTQTKQPVKQEIPKQENYNENGKVSSCALKRTIMEILRSQPETSTKLLNNLMLLYSGNAKQNSYCKILYMIEVNTAVWSVDKRMNLLRWYHAKLNKIINGRMY